MKTIKETCYKGTRILLGNNKRDMINLMIDKLKSDGFEEIMIPMVQYSKYFENKVGEENNNMMYNFTDRGGREICLAPEYTAIIQELSKTYFKCEKDVKVFYIQECFRGEKPQAGRFRQFTQLGVEIINPSDDYNIYLQELAMTLIPNTFEAELNVEVRRGLDYYKGGNGFEIICQSLGSSKQICGGGEYDGGIGFAIGIDRLIK